MSREMRIKAQLNKVFSPMVLTVLNESHQHNVPANSETHFNIVIVSEVFESKNRVARQRMVNQCLRDELDSGLHALTMKTWTPTEYESHENALDNPSPPCLGGGK